MEWREILSWNLTVANFLVQGNLEVKRHKVDYAFSAELLNLKEPQRLLGTFQKLLLLWKRFDWFPIVFEIFGTLYLIFFLDAYFEIQEEINASHKMLWNTLTMSKMLFHVFVNPLYNSPWILRMQEDKSMIQAPTTLSKSSVALIFNITQYNINIMYTFTYIIKWYHLRMFGTRNIHVCAEINLMAY